MTETVRDQRDWVANVTTLSGDIGASGNNADNSYHVVNGSGVTNTAVLDGFTVTQGQAYSFAIHESPDWLGGGMYNVGGSPTVRNTIFSANWAYRRGGGIYNENSSPTLSNVTFTGNVAYSVGGGGMDNYNSHPTMTDVIFNANLVPYGGGGGMYNESSSPALTNVTFNANSADAGGGMYNESSSPTLTNVTFNANSADYGGGISNASSSPTLTNVTFNANSAAYGGGMSNWSSSPKVRNSILWGSPNAHSNQINNVSSTLTISDSVVQGGYPGGSNIISADPRLGKLGNYGGSTPTIPLLPNSSAVDAVEAIKCPATDQRGMMRPQGSACDLGAFEARTMLAIIVVGSGTVTSQPAGIECPTGLCAMDYAPGTIVTLTATSHAGSTFIEWGGSCVGAGNCALSLDNGKSVTATFATKIIHVTLSGFTDLACGDSWGNACGLQYALTTVAAPGDELWVARGVYTPTTGTDRSVSFQLRDGIALYGGFAMTETEREQRDWTTNITTLSGDIGASGNNADNSYHVVNGSGVAQTTVLDGFTVTQGQANGSEYGSSFENSGGGMYNNGGSPTVRNTLFSANSATYGGGMYNEFGGNPTLTDVTFEANSTSLNGGGMENERSSPTLTNVTFSANSAGGLGGGIINFGNSPTLTNVTFNANSAKYGGGEMYSFKSNATLTNVTVNANLPGTSYGIYNYGSTLAIRNSILWGNIAPMGYDSTLTISDSVVQGGFPGGSNIITADPRLGPLGDYGGSTPTIPLLPHSSAVDAVNAAQCPATDQRGIQRPQGAACDLGAFEARAMLAIIVVGDGTVTSQPAGINCPTDLCAMDYAPGTVVTLTATPHSGSPFVWGGACWASAQCVVTLTAAQVVIATFTSNLVYLPIMHR
jgi:hypothetical protein